VSQKLVELNASHLGSVDHLLTFVYLLYSSSLQPICDVAGQHLAFSLISLPKNSKNFSIFIEDLLSEKTPTSDVKKRIVCINIATKLTVLIKLITELVAFVCLL